MNFVRVRIWITACVLVVGTVVVALGVLRAPILHAEAEAMKSDDASTWKGLVNDDHFKSMLDLQRGEIEKSIKSNGTFRRALKKLEGVGQLIAVLGNVQAYRSEGDDAKKAVALREAGLQLAKAAGAKNFEDAKKAAEQIAAYPEKITPAADDAKTKWTELIELGGVMHGVSVIDSETKSAVAASKPADFKKLADDAESQAMLLACLSVISRDYEEAEDWKGWCDQMREGSVGLAKAFGKKSHDDSKVARDELLKSCKDCHDVYRPDEK